MSQSRLWSPVTAPVQIITPTQMSALANNALVAGSAVNNVQGGGGLLGNTWAYVSLFARMAVAAAANTGFSLWLLKEDDGSVPEAGGTSYTPLRTPDLVFSAPVDTTQRKQTQVIWLPAGIWTPLIKNDGTGQATATDTTTGGSYLTIAPFTDQSV